MDILEKKKNYQYSPELKNIMKNLKYKNYKINLKGSASFNILKYPSDYDFYTYIKKKNTLQETINRITSIVNNMEKHTDTYFLTGIIFEDDKNKYRFDSIDNIDYKLFAPVFKNADFMKLDFVTFKQNKFIGLDCIYYFGEKELYSEEIIKTLKDDVKEYEKDKNYYKALKRKFRIYEEKGDYDNIKKLIEIFNSELGEKYEVLKNLETIKTILENDRLNKNKTVLKKINLNLKELNLESIKNINNLDSEIKNLNTKINKKAKRLNKEFNV